MYLYVSPIHDPFLNLATEEYLFEQREKNFISFYINRPSLVIGRNQVVAAEVNIPYVASKNIPVIRRISGGGTVYHDLANINYSYITNESNSAGNYAKMSELLQAFFSLEFDLNVKVSDTFGLTIGGRKISGMAQHVSKGRLIHHGTLLFNTDLKGLGDSLKVREGVFKKGVASNPAKVVNISSLLTIDMPTDIFLNRLVDFHAKAINTKYYILGQKSKSEIQHLAESKYKNWQWNMGRSPGYCVKRTINETTVNVVVQKGIIVEAEVNTEFPEIQMGLRRLKKMPHDYEAFISRWMNMKLSMRSIKTLTHLLF